MSYKVVIDSCGELLDEWKQDPRFESVALTLSVDGVNIIDDETFDQADFLKRVAECPECPKSACPSPERYMRAFDCICGNSFSRAEWILQQCCSWQKSSAGGSSGQTDSHL